MMSAKLEPAHASHDHDEVFDPAAHRPSSRNLGVVVSVAVLFLMGLVGVGLVPRYTHKKELAADVERAQVSTSRVLVVKPTRGQVGQVTLPSSVEPVRETVVYARTNGYVHKWNVDIGDSVKAGQVMATIDTPEVDQELRATEASYNQSKALVGQAKAQEAVAKTTKARYDTLQPAGVVTKQDAEDRNATFEVQTANVIAAQAAVASAEANMHRLRELKSFATVVAPFDGVVTARTTENGQLVSAGSTVGQQLFKVAKIDTMRLFVSVPQLYAPSIKVGQNAKIIIREYPQRSFVGHVARTARELDSATRTLLTEVDIANVDGALISGMYAQVELSLDRAVEPLLLPATALVVTAQGTRVAVVESGKIRWQVVTVENDLGDRISVRDGLSPNDVVVSIPGERLVDGLEVQTVEAPIPPIAPPTTPRAAAPIGNAKTQSAP
jgi:RND family efflux transporter MFP subunit